MRICVVGSGVIGSIYGYLFQQAGHDVTHLVRSLESSAARDGVRMRLLDGRAPNAPEAEVQYSFRATETLDPGDGYDLILASVRHYQVPDLLPVLARGAGDADVLFFNGLWTDLDPVDHWLPRSRYLWGFPVAGGGFRDGLLDAALLGDVRLGEVAEKVDGRLERVSGLFTGCGLEVDVRDDMLAWLWVHFATEAGIIGAAIKTGDPDLFLDSAEHLEEGVLAVRDALAVVRARGVDIESIPEAQLFLARADVAAAQIRVLYQVDRAARKIFVRHTGREELARIYLDVIATGDQLGVAMPVLRALQPWVVAYGVPEPVAV